MRISDWSSDVCSSDLQYSGRRIQTAGWIGKALFEQRRRIDIRPIIAVIGLMRDMVQRYAAAATFCGVAGAGQRAQGHAMEAVAEGHDPFAARHLARHLDQGFDGIGSSPSGSHTSITELTPFTRMEERSVGKEGLSQCRFSGS